MSENQHVKNSVKICFIKKKYLILQSVLKIEIIIITICQTFVKFQEKEPL